MQTTMEQFQKSVYSKSIERGFRIRSDVISRVHRPVYE